MPWAEEFKTANKLLIIYVSWCLTISSVWFLSGHSGFLPQLGQWTNTLDTARIKYNQTEIKLYKSLHWILFSFEMCTNYIVWTYVEVFMWQQTHFILHDHCRIISCYYNSTLLWNMYINILLISYSSVVVLLINCGDLDYNYAVYIHLPNPGNTKVIVIFSWR